MKKLYVLAALLMATTAAHAGNSISVEINGNRIHIEVPRNCDALSCMQISASGLSGSGFGKSDRFDDEPDRYNDKPDRYNDKPNRFSDKSDRYNDKSDRFDDRSDRFNDKPNRFGGRFNRFNNKSDRVDDNDAAARSDQPAPKPAPAPAANNAAPVAAAAASTPTAPAVTNDVAPATPVPAKVAIVAPTQAAADAAPVEAPTTPIGVWATEENKGNVRVEPCGPNLCGYAEKTGEKILINMKASNSKWTGRIHDPDSGRDYDSTIAMKGANAMRVQGCAFGGMFCGGQTWKRVS
jgi:uncharacterized protein (DUF2147 family)